MSGLGIARAAGAARIPLWFFAAAMALALVIGVAGYIGSEQAPLSSSDSGLEKSPKA